jgi:hypothetical protein
MNAELREVFMSGLARSFGGGDPAEMAARVQIIGLAFENSKEVTVAMRECQDDWAARMVWFNQQSPKVTITDERYKTELENYKLEMQTLQHWKKMYLKVGK